MVLVHNVFSTFIMFAAYQTARLGVGLAQAARRRSERDRRISTSDFRDSEHRSNWSRRSTLRQLPGSVFDPRYKGLTGIAAFLDIAICRQEGLR